MGDQRQFNYALQPMSKEEFVRIVAADQPEVPAYFPKSAAKNLEGSRPLSELLKPVEMSSAEIRDFDGVVIDIRTPGEYGAGHVPNSINIGLGGQFASWAGTLIPMATPIAIVADNQKQIDEAAMRLARVGHESVTGYILIGNFDGEKKTVEQVPVETASQLTAADDDLQFIDVRRLGEYNNGHARRAINLSLDKLALDLDKIDPAKPTYVICQGGYRSSIGTGILENAGFSKLYNVTGGTAAWIAAGLPTESSAVT